MLSRFRGAGRTSSSRRRGTTGSTPCAPTGGRTALRSGECGSTASSWFSTDPASQKGRNLERDDRALVHLESGDDVVILEGQVAKTDWSDDVIDAYDAKYAFRLDASNESYGMYVFRPRLAQTWTERRFPQNAVRWTFSKPRTNAP